MKQLTTIIIIALFTLTLNALSFTAEYYVDAVKGDNANTGSTADDAWKNISHALTLAEGTSLNPAVIHIKSGTYNQATGELFPFELKNNVHLSGVDNLSVILDASNSEKTVIRCNKSDNVLIENLTIRGGEGEDKYGGGINCNKSSPIIRNCIITDNAILHSGGGIYCEDASPEIIDCIIKNNISEWGGGIACNENSNPKITNCRFENNEAILGNSGVGPGGGIYCENSSPEISDCLFKGNMARFGCGITCCSYSSPKIENCIFEKNSPRIAYYCFGGGIYCNIFSSPVIEGCIIRENTAGGGSGIFITEDSDPYISNCIIENNKAEKKEINNLDFTGYGGGIFLGERTSPCIENCIISGNSAMSGGAFFITKSKPRILNCIIRNNNAAQIEECGGDGGGFLIEKDSETTLVNVLIEGNTGENGGAIKCTFGSSANLIHTTIAGNTAEKGSGIYIFMKCSINLSSCIVFNNSGEGIEGSITANFSNIEGGYGGEGNIDEDPVFVSGPRGDYYLSCIQAGDDCSSPCIDAGSTESIEEFNPKEYITRCDGVVDTGSPDMGFHYIPHINFGLGLSPVKFSYKDGDEITLNLDLKTAPVQINADIYLLLLTPEGKFHSGFSWDKGLQPLVSNMTLPADLEIEASPLFTFTIPGTDLPVEDPGWYTFYMVALKPGTVDFISNIASTTFQAK